MIFLWLLLVFGTAAKAQVSISIPDTVISESVRHLVLKVSGELPAADSVRMHFTYNSSRLNILKITGGVGNLISCASPTFSSTSGESTGELELQCDAIRGGTGTLFEFEIEVAKGIDSVAKIIPDSIIINGKQEQFLPKPGIVHITGPRFQEKLIEGVAQNAPNPFVLNTSFYYTLEKDSPVHFRIYSVMGQLVRDFDIFNQIRGYHRFIFDALPGEFASGSYYLTMTTDSGMYVANLLCLK